MKWRKKGGFLLWGLNLVENGREVIRIYHDVEGKWEVGFIESTCKPKAEINKEPLGRETLGTIVEG